MTKYNSNNKIEQKPEKISNNSLQIKKFLVAGIVFLNLNNLRVV